jgi:hypothetical protein
MRDFNLIKRKLYPEGVVLGFSDTAKRGRDAVRTRTRKIFKLHSDYIPRGVMHLPDRSKPNSIKASIKGLVGKYRDFEASVFLRGSHNPQGDLGFMLFHETGKDKSSQDGPGKIAIPRSGVVNANSKTSKGRRRKRFKPEKMLEYYNTKGPTKKGTKRVKGKRRLAPKPFLFTSGGRTYIVKRNILATPDTKNKFIFLYRFVTNAKIAKVWGFVDTVHREVRRHLVSDVTKQLNKIKKRRT